MVPSLKPFLGSLIPNGTAAQPSLWSAFLAIPASYQSDSFCATRPEILLITLNTLTRDFFLIPFCFCFFMVLSFQLTLILASFPFPALSITAFTFFVPLALNQACLDQSLQCT